MTEIIKVKDVQLNDYIIISDKVQKVKGFREWAKPACMGVMGFGGIGDLILYRDKNFSKSSKTFWEKFCPTPRKWNYTDTHPDDPDYQWVQIAEDLPVIRIKNIEELADGFYVKLYEKNKVENILSTFMEDWGKTC